MTERLMNSSLASCMDSNTLVVHETSSLVYPWQKVCIITEILPSRLQKQISFNRKCYTL